MPEHWARHFSFLLGLQWLAGEQHPPAALEFSPDGVCLRRQRWRSTHQHTQLASVADIVSGEVQPAELVFPHEQQREKEQQEQEQQQQQQVRGMADGWEGWELH